MINAIEGEDDITEEHFVRVMMSFDGAQKLTNNPGYITTSGLEYKIISNRAYFGQSRRGQGLKDPIFPESSLNYFLSYFANKDLFVASVGIYTESLDSKFGNVAKVDHKMNRLCPKLT